MDISVSRTDYDRFAIDVSKCIKERRSHPTESRDLVLAYYTMSWGRQIAPQYFTALIIGLEYWEREAAQ